MDLSMAMHLADRSEQSVAMVAGKDAMDHHGHRDRRHQQQHQQQEPLCCVMVPMLGMGHIIPMVDLGLLLADQGVSVTLFTTAGNANRLLPTVARARAASLDFTVTALPHHAQGLPDGMDNTDLTSSPFEFNTLIYSVSQLDAPVRDHLKCFDPSRTFMVSDFSLSWTRFVSRDLGIPRYVFYSVPCFSLFCNQVLQRFYEAGGAEDESEPFVVPGLPHRIELTRAQAPVLFEDASWREEAEDALASADGIIVNTSAAVEGEYLGLLEKEIGKTVWPVGPVALCNSVHTEFAATRGNTPSVEASQIVEWLDRQKFGSVVFVCLGSQAQPTPEQAAEIGLGLEASGRPFLWAVRGRGMRLEKVEAWLGAGFEERTKDRGLVIRGWAPQQLILSHAAIGGFVTHCAWNSLSEALASGVPVATWPCFFDQFMNERFVVDVLGVGVSGGVKDPQYWWGDKLMLGRERVEEVVRELMGTGEEAEKRRARAREIGEEFRDAMQVGKGGSWRALEALIQEAARRAGETRVDV